MHDSALAYAARQMRAYWPRDNRILEVGAFNVNGSVRSACPGGIFTGLDIRPGPGVDLVATVPWPLDCGSFGLVVCTEALEHDTLPWRTLAEIARVLRRGGFAVLTARGFDEESCFPFHEPPDYWRFTLGGFQEMCYDAGLGVVNAEADPDYPGVFVTASK